MYYHYEFAAAKNAGIDVEKIFTKSRRKKIVLARQFLMHYRIVTLKKNQTVAGERYGLNCKTARWGKNKVASWIELYPEIKAKYEEFLGLCESEFFNSVYLKSSDINTTLKKIIEMSTELGDDFESHEKIFSAYLDCSQYVSELGKIITNKWKEQ